MEVVVDKEPRIWHMIFDDEEPVEVIAADEWEALNKTEPRDADGRRTWRRALAFDVTPEAPDYCTLQDI